MARVPSGTANMLRPQPKRTDAAELGDTYLPKWEEVTPPSHDPVARAFQAAPELGTTLFPFSRCRDVKQAQEVKATTRFAI
jgi:hypothetical protein